MAGYVFYDAMPTVLLPEKRLSRREKFLLARVDGLQMLLLCACGYDVGAVMLSAQGIGIRFSRIFGEI